jgi:Uma2 family endonuclease
MAAYQGNCVRLGWLLIPHARAVEVWSASGESQRLEQSELLQVGVEFPGLQLQLAKIWAG